MFLNRVRLRAHGSGLRGRVISGVLLMFAISACGSSEPPTPEGKTIPAPPDVAAPPPGSLKTTSGLSTKVLQSGSGTRHPRRTDRVRVHYTGWTTDGKMFDSSVVRNEPTEFAVNQVIPGWTEGLQLMVEGEKRRFWIPANLAYEGQPGQPQGMLVFDVELIRIL
jgi:FKBP-type peptidyl-prolyl cis-trans isomerase